MKGGYPIMIKKLGKKLELNENTILAYAIDSCIGSGCFGCGCCSSTGCTSPVLQYNPNLSQTNYQSTEDTRWSTMI